MKFAADLRLLLLALWLGAAIFFSFAVAPGAFAVLPSRDLAGAVVNRTLAILNYGGIIVGLILLTGSFLIKNKITRGKVWGERILLILLIAACAVGQFVIGLRLHQIREQIARPIEELAANDPLRVEFGSLHVYSVAVLGFAMIAGLIVYFLLTQRLKNENTGK